MTPDPGLAPEGTVVNPVLPAACGARGVIGYRVYDAIMGALAQVVPDRVIAAGEGGPTLIAFGGYDDARRPFVHDGGDRRRLGRPRDERRARGGLEPARQPLEPAGRAARERPAARGRAVRARLRLRGAGELRGGLAYEREYRVLAERATLTIRSDRRFHPPYGLEGGLPGGPSRNTIRRATGRESTCRRCRWRRSTLSARRPLPAPLRGRRRLRLPARARSRARCSRTSSPGR